MPHPPTGSEVASVDTILAGLPSATRLSQRKDIADSFSELRTWLRHRSAQGDLSKAGELVSLDHRKAVLEFLDYVSTGDPIRKKLAKELLVKLSSEDAWCNSNLVPASVEFQSMWNPFKQSKQNVIGRSSSVSGTRLSADPIRHKLASDLLGRMVQAEYDADSLAHPKHGSVPCANIGAPIPRCDNDLWSWRQPLFACTSARDADRPTTPTPVTVTFCIPQSCHHMLVGKQGERISKLQTAHGVTILVPKLEDACEAVAISGTQSAVEGCRRVIEELLCLPIGTEPLHKIVLGVPKSSYGVIIGERGAVLQQLMHDCSVLIMVPKLDEAGDVAIRGRLDDCLRAKTKIEDLLRDTVHVLSTGKSKVPALPLPPSYDLTVSDPIRRCLFFPEETAASHKPYDSLSSLATFLKFLDSTRVSCDVCVFTITDNRIARRLLDAHRYRSVKVRIITDKAQSDALGSDVAEFQEAGIEVRTNRTEHHMHHKFCILDGRVLMNGSFNWTQGACENNSENVMITNDKAFVSPFCAQFAQLWQECIPLHVQRRWFT
jgi:hypothetical protein